MNNITTSDQAQRNHEAEVSHRIPSGTWTLEYCADCPANQVYVENGYTNRADYLDSLADEYGSNVYALADILGENEDFDGLVSSLEDMEGGY